MKIKDIPAVDVKEEQIEIILESITIEQDIPLTWSIDEQGTQNDDGTITPVEIYTLEQTTGEEADIVDGQIINKLTRAAENIPDPKHYIRISATADNNPDNTVGAQIIFKADAVEQPDVDLLEWSASSKEWANTWTSINKPITIAASYLGKPVPGVLVSLVISKNDKELDVELVPDSIKTNALGLAEFFLVLKSPISVEDAAIEVTATAGDSTLVFPISFEPVVLTKPFIVAMNDGVVNDADIIESIQGIRANVTLSASGGEVIPAGSILGFTIDNVVYEQSLEEDSTALSLVINESLLTNGEHYIGFYVVDFSGNATFSSLTYINVERVNGGGGSPDLSEPAKIYYTDSEVSFINRNLALGGLRVRLPKPEYLVYDSEGETVPESIDTVFTEAQADWNHSVILTGLDEKFNQLFVETYALKDFTFDPPLTQDGENFIPSPFPYLRTFERIGEGYIEIRVVYYDKDNKAYHSSQKRRYFVDVIPPAGSKVSDTNNDLSLEDKDVGIIIESYN